MPPAPTTTCQPAAKPVDVSHPTNVVGSGAGTCTEKALADAVAAGGVITFDCGAAPVTITLTAELGVTKDTTIDGGNLVTLSGGGTTRILHIKSAWNVATPLLTVQNLSFTRGYTTDVPDTTSTTQGGAAIFEDGGSLTVVGCTFTDNHCASTGQDVSGGAINGQGIGTLVVEGSVFAGNSGSNGGAIGTQAENVTISNSTFDSNSATGTDGNPGNGGDGGAMSYDGQDNTWTMCGRHVHEEPRQRVGWRDLPRRVPRRGDHHRPLHVRRQLGRRDDGQRGRPLPRVHDDHDDGDHHLQQRGPLTAAASGSGTRLSPRSPTTPSPATRPRWAAACGSRAT